MKNYGIFATLAAGLMAINSLNAEALDEPIITIGAGTVERGSSVEIPVVFDNYDGFTAVQFDLTFDPSFFDEVDTSRCFNH